MRPGGGHRKTDEPIAMYMISRRELFVRELQAGGHLRMQTAAILLEWINRVELEVHPGFRRMLEKMLKQKLNTVVVSKVTPAISEEGNGKFETREKMSLSKLLVALAITEYGYNPEARRSPIPREMQDVALKLGLELSQDTIRHYLQMGAKHLPKDWKLDS